MRRYRPRLLAVAACRVCFCRAWVPTSPSQLWCHQLPSIRGKRSTPWSLTVVAGKTATIATSSQRLRRARQTTRVAMASSDDIFGGPEEETEEFEEPPLPRAKMDETPIPDYLVDMLKEAGEVDENGKPVNDFYDPDDDDTFGSKRFREHQAEVENDYFDVPFGEMLFEGKDKNKEFEGSLMDTTISAAVDEYGFPVEFFLDMLSRWGVTPPINQDRRLGDLIDAEQAYALGEALTGLDSADVRDNYLSESLEDLAFEMDIPLPDLFQACAAEKINLPLGGDTHITIDEYKTLLDAVVEGGELSPTRKFFDENRMSNRWSGQKDLASREATQADLTRITQNNNWGHGWKDGPPVIGDGDGELSVNMAHVSGRIFAEDVFSMAEVEEGDEDNAEFFFSDATGEDEDARQ